MLRSKYARTKYYEVRTHPGGRLVSRHNTLMSAKRAMLKDYKKRGATHRIYDQDGRAYL